MVPVGGSVVAGFDPALVDAIAKSYPGRASGAPSLDVLITLLGMGVTGVQKSKAERKEVNTLCCGSICLVVFAIPAGSFTCCFGAIFCENMLSRFCSELLFSVTGFRIAQITTVRLGIQKWRTSAGNEGQSDLAW